MRDKLGRFVKGQPSENPDGLKLGHGWNKGKKGWTNSGSFKEGHKVSLETKIAVGKSSKGNTYRKEKTHTEEANEKNRRAHLRKVTMSGNNHYNWKGGITPLRKRLYFSKKYQIWRDTVFLRDDYTCQKCKARGGELNADHIKPWSTHQNLQFVIDNGRTLCVDCHRQTDTWGARPLFKERLNYA